MPFNSTILRMPDVVRATGLSESTIRNRINPLCRWYDPTFPEPVKLSPGKRGAIGWRNSDIEAWINSREKLH
jgi:prophage regulatory protein